jgi:methylmalonyl-CoA mutase
MGPGQEREPQPGRFIIEELTDLVEEAVLQEFERIAERGGVLGAMETGYQRGKIQEESLYYEQLKHDGTYPIIGVNTFRNPNGDPTPKRWSWPAPPRKKSRASCTAWRTSMGAPGRCGSDAGKAAQAVIDNRNVFAVLMDAVRVCSLGQITHALFEVGGQYRRNM